MKKDGIDSIFSTFLQTACVVSHLPIDEVNKLYAAKNRIFWKALAEIASIGQNSSSGRKYAFELLMYETGENNFLKVWLPMHYALVVSNSDLEDIQTIFEHDPESIKQVYEHGRKFTPCHLAVMTKDPNMAVIEQLKVFDPAYGARVTIDRQTPLHLAAEHSNSVAVIQELIRVYPAALEMRDRSWDTPLCRSFHNNNPEAPEILQALIDAAPDTASIKYRNQFPFHQLLIDRYYSTQHFDDSCTEKMVSILLRVFPDVVDIRGSSEFRSGLFPVEIASEHCKTSVLKTIVEATSVNVLHTCSQLAHQAAGSCNLSNIQYVHSIMPELLLSVDYRDKTPLHCAVSSGDYTFIAAVAALAPDAARMVDRNGDNLLHIHIRSNLEELQSVMGLNIMRLLLRLIPGGAVAINGACQTPYDLLDVGDYVARRLLLLAGASSLHPETLKQMNYEARKGALLAFFGTRVQDSSVREDICYRIRHGEGAMELIRQIVSFL